MKAKTSAKWALPLIITLYLLLGFAYSLINPILESPDELLNYQNMRTIATDGALPVLRPGEFSKAHHPPLYYLLGAALTSWIPDEHLAELAANTNQFWGYQLYEPGNDNKSQYLHDPALTGWPYQDVSLAIHLLRWLSLLMGAGVILAAAGTARLLFVAEPALWWGTAVLIAFNPMFLYIQSSVHNDALTNLLAALTIFGVVRYWQKGPSVGRVAFIGVVAGLGILTKITFLFLGPMVILALILRSWQDRHSHAHWLPELLKMVVIGGGIVLALAGWWFVRNQLLYGEPTSMELQASIWQPRENAPDWTAAISELDYLRDSFWGAFGFGQITMPRPVYTALALLDLFALIGLIIWAIRARKHQGSYRVPALLLAVLLAAPLAAFAATFYRMTISGSANFGRYLFTAYAVIAPLLALGLTEWFPASWRRRFLMALTAVLLLLSTYALWGVLWPAYAPPPRYANVAELAIPQPTTAVYPGLATLLGYGLEPETAVPGETLVVTLYWQVTGETAENYPLFVQLVDSNGRRIAGRDTHAGLGRYPTSRWQTGEIMADTIPLPIPTATDGPTGVLLTMGLRDEDGRLLPTDNHQTTITLGTIRLGPGVSATTDLPALYHLGEGVDLVEIVVPEETAVPPGTALPFQLTWHTRQNLERDYSVFIHLLDANGRLVETYDQPPQAGAYPTSLWLPGDVVSDERQIQLPPDLPPGTYTVVAGWYSLDDFSRLTVTDTAGQPVANEAIPLFTLEIGD
jgi:4-amino-4-deoxy-L-arabinose transferase-like glycosyltransferase